MRQEDKECLYECRLDYMSFCHLPTESCRDHIVCQKKNMEIRRRLQMKDHPLLKTMQGSKTLSILSFVSIKTPLSRRQAF